MTAGPRPEYVHHLHPYLRNVDAFGVACPACPCGETAIPGGRECAECLMARVHRDDEEQQR